MSLNDLFAVDTTVRLTPDSNTWADQIVAALINKFPSISKLVGEVIFSKVDATKGTSVGYISLIGKTQRIPFIVDEFELNPIDIYIDNGMYLPLSENSVSRLEKREWPFRLVSQSERNTIIKTASFFSGSGDLKDSFIAKHKDEIQKIAQEYPELLEQFVTKTASVPNEKQDVFRYFIKEAASDKPIVARNLSEPDKEYKVSEFVKLHGQKLVTKLMTDREIFISNLPPTVVLALDQKDINGAYKDCDGNVGYYELGGVMKQVKRFEHFNISNLEKNTNYPSILLTKDGTYNHNCGGITLKMLSSQDTTMSFHTQEPSIGDLCGFIIGDRFYGPFQFDSIGVNGNDRIFTITDNELKKVTIRTTSEVKFIIKLDDKNYLANSSINLMKIQREKNVYDDGNNTNFLKTASAKIIVNKKLNGSISVNDGGLSGINNLNTKDLHKGDAKVALMKAGLSKTDADYVVMKATEDNSFSFDMPAKTASVKEVKDSSIPDQIVKQCDDSHLLKVAVITGDKSNIDLALGLNLLTWNNVKRFKLLVPEIYKMLDRMCKLLIVKRMNRGLLNIEESEFTQAIFALENIATVLGSL